MRLFQPILTFVLILFSLPVYAQTSSYKNYVSLAASKYHTGQYEEAARYYALALRTDTTSYNPSDAYNGACSFALIAQQDSSFLILFKIANNKKYFNYNHLIADSDLNSLHGDMRWAELCAIIKRNQAQRDTGLVALFDTIFTTDQEYRIQMMALQKQGVTDSVELTNVENNINRIDAINVSKVSSLLDKYGWLGPEKIGDRGVVAEFLVIQHAPLSVQEKYFPLLQKAAEGGELRKMDFAILQDRMLVRKNKEQIYGSQIGYDNVSNKWYVLPLKDPDGVDKRRGEVGLSPIAEYVKEWNIVWDVKAYKEFIRARDSR